MMRRTVKVQSWRRRAAWTLVALATMLLASVQPVIAHLNLGDVLQLFSYESTLVPAPIDGNISPDAAPDKWSSAHVRSITFASQDGSIVKNGTLLLTNDADFLYLGVGFNSQSAGNVNYAQAYFDENHDHVLAGSTSIPGEYYVRITGSGPSIVTNGGHFGSSGWQDYGVTPAGLEGAAQKHGTGNPTTWNFEFKIPLNTPAGGANENFLNVTDIDELGILIEVNDASDGVLYWQPSGRDPLDPSTWGEALLGVAGPEREVAGSVTLGHDPVIDGVVSTESEWLHYTTSSRAVQFTNYDGRVLSGRLYTKSNASNIYIGMVINSVSANPGDRLTIFTDQDAAGGGDLDYALTDFAEHASRVTYVGTGTGAHTDRHFEATPDWPTDAVPDGFGAVTHTGTDYEFEFRIPMSGTGNEDIQATIGALLGMNVEFFDVITGESFWWVFASNSSSQLMRVDALEHSALGWLRLQTGAPAIQPVFPKDADEVSGHFPFVIYATSATGELDIISAEFSDDLGASWQALERIDEGGLWNRTWDTTVWNDGPREIRIRAEDVNGITATAVIDVDIDNSGGGGPARPEITLTAPDAGTYVSDITNITFTSLPAAGRTILDTEISIDGNPYTSTTSPHPWDTTLEGDGSHLFRVRALQSDGLYGYSEVRLVLVDNAPPAIEAVQVSYPAGQTAARAGDDVVISAIVRDAGAGLDAGTVSLNSVALDGVTHVLVDDGTQGDAVAGDHVYSYSVNVTDTSTGTVSALVTANDVLGNASNVITADVELDNTAPAHVSTASSDDDAIYKNTDVVTFVSTWDAPGHAVTADFSAVDVNYAAGSEQVTDNGDGTYTIVYAISFGNTSGDAGSLAIPVTAYDRANNGPAMYAGFTVELDNTPPAISSVGSDQESYQNGNTIVLTATMDDSTYSVWSDFSMIDSNYTAGSESVTRIGSVYTIVYTVSSPTNETPDGSYDIPVHAEDIAGNAASLSTSVILDNTAPDVEAVSVAYPEGQGAARQGDVVVLSALVRDHGAGLDITSVSLDANLLDGGTYTLVDDGTQGDAVAADNVFSYAVTVTSVSTGPVLVTVSASDVLGNTSLLISGTVELDNTAPTHLSTVSSDADVVYKNTDVIKLTTTWDAPDHLITADFSAIDAHYVPGAEQVIDNGDSTYTILYEVSFENGTADAAGLGVPVTAFDTVGNGPTLYAGFSVELDNTAPDFISVDSGQDNYADGETIVLIVTLDDSTYTVWSDFSMIDSNYTNGAETVNRSGNVYTITYAIAADPQNNTPDGSYDIPVHAEDIAGNQSSLSTSVELDNTREAVTILQPGDGDLITGDVTIDVTSADDTRFVRFQVSPDGGTTWYSLGGTQSPDYTQDDDATDGWTQVWSTVDDGLPDGVDYQIRVLAYDEQNPTAHLIGQDVVGGGLIVDNTPPVLSIAVFPIPSLTALSGDVYTEEILVRGTYFDLPDSTRVVGLTIEHRNPDGDDVNDSPIAIPAEDRAFSRRLRLIPGMNHITVTALDEAGLTSSQSADLNFVAPEQVVTIGPAGGVVQSPDGTTLTIPPGALQHNVDISVTPVPPDELFPTSDPRVTLLKVAHAFEPADLVFHKPVEIVLTYTDADLDPDQNGIPNWGEDELESFFWDGFQWVRTDPPDRDSAANTVALKTNHLATFDLGVMSAGAAQADVYWTRNPMNPVDGTTCVYDLPEAGELSLKIYDLSGQLVRTVVNREPIDMAGSLRWDGQNDFDGFVGSGVYVYVFSFRGNTGSQVTVRKPLGVVK